MKYTHNQICTRDSEIVVGKQYDYSEDGMRMRVKVLEDISDDERISFKLKILSEPKGENFTVYAARGNYAYNGMWRLWDAGEYLRGEYSEEDNIPDGELIGYSLSKCVSQIARNNIPVSRIKKLITGTAAKNEESWERLISHYVSSYWYPYKDKALQIVKELRAENKIFQPRLGDKEEYKSWLVWEKA